MYVSFPGYARQRGLRSLRRGAAVALAMMAMPAMGQSLTLEDVVARAAAADPALAAAAARMKVVEAAVRQAGIRPNPSLSVEVENFAGTGRYGPPNMAESTISYQQQWERSSKREARIGAARSEMGVVAAQARVRSLDFLEQVEMAWVEALAAQARIAIAEDNLGIAQGTLAEVERRVNAALDPLFAAQRARTAVAQARIARDQAIMAAGTARANLARFWGGSGNYELDASVFERMEPDQAGVASGAGEKAPDMELLLAQKEAAARQVDVARSQDAADPTFNGGVRHLAETGDFALVIGASLPLGTRRVNRANVERAKAEQGAAEAELAVSRVERDREIAALVASRAAIAEEIRRIDRDVLPSARRAVTLVNDGLRRGGLAFTYLEAASARQVVAEARARRIDLLQRYHLEGARIDRLTGRFTPFLSSAENR